MHRELQFEHRQGERFDFEQELQLKAKLILTEIILSALWKPAYPHSFPETIMFKHKAYIKIVQALVVCGALKTGGAQSNRKYR